MKCLHCNIDMEEGWLINNAQNWAKGNPLGKNISAKLSGGMAVTALRCPICGEVKIYTTENLSK